MAIFTPSALIGAISGSVGGVTFQRPGSHQAIRARYSRGRPATLAQSTQRARYQFLNAAWETVRVSNFEAWANFARSHSFRNALGQARQPSARDAFIRFNLGPITPGISYYSAPGANPFSTDWPSLRIRVTFGSRDVQIPPADVGFGDALVLDVGIGFTTAPRKTPRSMRFIMNTIVTSEFTPYGTPLAAVYPQPGNDNTYYFRVRRVSPFAMASPGILLAWSPGMSAPEFPPPS